MTTDFALTHLSRPPLKKGETPAPVILLLHGVGSNEQDLMGLADYLDPHWHLISARAPIVLGMEQYGWYRLQISANGQFTYDGDQARATLQRLTQFIEEIRATYAQEGAPLFLMGFSQGAIMSSAVLFTRPELVEGAVLMSGRSAEEFIPLPSTPDALTDKPVLIVHGVYDEVLPIVQGRALRDTFATLPVALEYEEFPIGHSVSLESLQRIRHWLTAVLRKEA